MLTYGGASQRPKTEASCLSHHVIRKRCAKRESRVGGRICRALPRNRCARYTRGAQLVDELRRRAYAGPPRTYEARAKLARGARTPMEERDPSHNGNPEQLEPPDLERPASLAPTERQLEGESPG